MVTDSFPEDDYGQPVFSHIHLNIFDGGSGYSYSGGVLLHDGRVVFVPYYASKILIFDPATNEYSTIPGPIVKSSVCINLDGTKRTMWSGDGAYSGGVLLKDGRVVFVPSNARTIGIFDPTTNEYSTIPGAPGSSAYRGGVLLHDGRVLFVPYMATTIGMFDPVTNEYSTIPGAPGKNAYSDGVLLKDGRVVFVPYMATTIGIFDPANDSYSTIARGMRNSRYSGGVLLPDSRVLFVPHGTKNIEIFNPATNKISTIAMSSKDTDYFDGGMLLPDGRVVFTPSIGRIGIFNPVMNEYSTIDISPNMAKYYNSVLLPNGRIVFVPRNSSNIGILSFSNLSMKRIQARTETIKAELMALVWHPDESPKWLEEKECRELGLVPAQPRHGGKRRQFAYLRYHH